MANAAGFEPASWLLESQILAIELHTHVVLGFAQTPDGAEGRIRTYEAETSDLQAGPVSHLGTSAWH